MKQLLLISSSRYNGGEYLAHCARAMQEFLGILGKKENIAFVPYAYAEAKWDSYTKDMREIFNGMGYNLMSVHDETFDYQLIADKNTKAIFVGGGNTFRLLKEIYHRDIIEIIKRRVNAGEIKYIGISAGSNVACPTIKTTNDMPIVYPPSLIALNLINFQINPHFISGKIPGHMGEDREYRIKEFHEENDIPVVGLPESNWIKVDGEECRLCGAGKAVVFRKNGDDSLWISGRESFVIKKERIL